MPNCNFYRTKYTTHFLYTHITTCTILHTTLYGVQYIYICSTTFIHAVMNLYNILLPVHTVLDSYSIEYCTVRTHEYVLLAVLPFFPSNRPCFQGYRSNEEYIPKVQDTHITKYSLKTPPCKYWLLWWLSKQCSNKLHPHHYIHTNMCSSIYSEMCSSINSDQHDMTVLWCQLPYC